MKVFLTGGTGYLGSHIAMLLLKEGHEVTILARSPGLIPAFNNMPGLKIVKGAMDSFDIIRENIKGHDACIHTARTFSSFFADEPASNILNVDVYSSLRLFEAAAENGVKDAVFASSSMALGDYRHNMNEDMNLLPFNYYGSAKASIECFMLGHGP